MLHKTLAVLALTAALLNADMIIAPNSLPQNIQNFIATHFKAQIGLVEMDRKSYEIYLTDGTQLDRDRKRVCACGFWGFAAKCGKHHQGAAPKRHAFGSQAQDELL